jgi:hypothetical protein
VADINRFLPLECFNKRRKIAGVSAQLVVASGLA